MATIGTFTLDRDGSLKGQIKTLNLSAEVSMEPVESDKEGAPAYRLYAGAVELGAAWAKTAKESGREYHQVRLDDPSFPAPIFANLIEDEDSGSFALIWNRPKPKTATRRGEGNHRGQSRTERPTSKRPPEGAGRSSHPPVAYRDQCGPTSLAPPVARNAWTRDRRKSPVRATTAGRETALTAKVPETNRARMTIRLPRELAAANQAVK